MSKRRMRRMLEQIARDNHTTPQEVRKQMQLALDEAQSCPDPVVQAKWHSIPHKCESIVKKFRKRGKSQTRENMNEQTVERAHIRCILNAGLYVEPIEIGFDRLTN